MAASGNLGFPPLPSTPEHLLVLGLTCWGVWRPPWCPPPLCLWAKPSVPGSCPHLAACDKVIRSVQVVRPCLQMPRLGINTLGTGSLLLQPFAQVKVKPVGFLGNEPYPSPPAYLHAARWEQEVGSSSYSRHLSWIWCPLNSTGPDPIKSLFLGPRGLPGSELALPDCRGKFRVPGLHCQGAAEGVAIILTLLWHGGKSRWDLTGWPCWEAGVTLHWARPIAEPSRLALWVFTWRNRGRQRVRPWPGTPHDQGGGRAFWSAGGGN